MGSLPACEDCGAVYRVDAAELMDRLGMDCLECGGSVTASGWHDQMDPWTRPVSVAKVNRCWENTLRCRAGQ